FRKARAKAELKFQKARADVSQAEIRFTRAGGETIPERLTITGTQAPVMGGTPAE
ncbi:MAG: multidrug efflux pump subunit AcrA (membrane-fusion protein), partial [Myxococcota bacterium]